MALRVDSRIRRPLCRWILILCCGLPALSFSQDAGRPDDASPFAEDTQDAAFDRDAKRMAVQLRSVTADHREKLSQELKALNEKHFEYRQQRRKRELDELSAGVERMRVAYERRQEQKANVLARRFVDLTDPSVSGGWDDVTAATGTTHNKSSTKVPNAESDSNTVRESESTYNGVSLAKWLETLEHERNREKVADAVIALNHFVDQANPDKILSAVFKLVNAQSTIPPDQYSEAIRRGAICLLFQIPSDIVSEAFQLSWEQGYALPEPRIFISLTLAELATKADEDDNAAFLARFPQARRFLPLAFQNHSTKGIFQLPSKDTMSPLQADVKSLAPRLMQLLVNAVQRNPEVRSAAVEDGNLVLRISRQPLTTYPEFIPIVEADLEDPRSSHIAAARLLAEIGRKVPQVIEFVNLQFAAFDKSPARSAWSLEETLHDLELLAPHTPEAVDLLIERFRNDCSKLADLIKSREPNDILGLVRNQSDICGHYILALARIGTPAERVIPELQKIVESVQAEVGGPVMVDSQWPWTFHRFWFDLTGEVKWPFSLQDLSDAAIKVIQTPKRNTPAVTEAPVQNPALSTNASTTPAAIKDRNELVKRRERAEAHLKQLESQDNRGGVFEERYKQAKENLLLLKELEALSASNNTLNANPGAPKDEPTFDGTPYSTWLKMLETERKPQKVAQAMEAASRLAPPEDQPRVADLIFLVAEMFERGDSMEHQTVSQAGYAALRRLPAPIVLEALIRALRDPIRFSSSRNFQVDLVLFWKTNEFDEALKPKATTVAQHFVHWAAANPPSKRECLAGAFKIIKNHQIPIESIPSAKQLGLEAIERGSLNSVPADVRFGQVPWPVGWFVLVDAFVELAPDTPGLPEALVKHADKHVQVIDRIGRLGERASSVTPQLVELFLKLTVPPKPQAGTVDADATFPTEMHTQIVKTLGQIRATGDGYRLIRECKAMQSEVLHSLASPQEKIFFEGVDEAWPKLIPPEQTEFHSALLSDEILISGLWALMRDSAKPDEESAGTFILIPYPQRVRNIWELHQNKDGSFEHSSASIIRVGSIEGSSVLHLSQHATKPKHLVISDGGRVKKEVLYELGETSLRILVVKDGVPIPNTFPSEDDPLPDGTTVLEFGRNPSKATEKSPGR